MFLFILYYIPATEKLDFHLPYFYIIVKITVEVNVITCLLVDTIIKTENTNIIIQKNARF